MDKLPIVYVDANILLDYITEPDPADKRKLGYHLAAQTFFEAVGRGEMIAIISDLVLMEVLGVLRKQKTKPSNITMLVSMGQNAQTKFVIDSAKEIFQDLMTDMLKSPQYFRFMKPLNLNITDLFATASDILYDMKGDLRFFRTCDNCCNKQESGDPIVCVHKCVGAVDIIHALVANELECTKLVTFDKGFNELKGNYKIFPLDIEVLEPEVS